MTVAVTATTFLLLIAAAAVSPASVFTDPYGSNFFVSRFDADALADKQLLDTFSTSTFEPKQPKPNILTFHVNSEISNRYARTLVKSRVANPANVSQEVVFSIIIPDTAFITSFAMEVDGKIYKAYVKEKEEAKRVYNEAVNRGQTAAHVSARDADRFSVAVNIEAQSKVSFNLTYEELLQLTHGLYKHAININPGQIVPDMTIDVHIVELREITNLKVNDVQSANEIDNEVSENPKAQVEWINPNETKIHFKADEAEQRRLEKKNKLKTTDKSDSEGVAGKFVVEYNVQRDPAGGEVIVNDGYFVHFFAPHELPQLTKHVLFVLDVSGSMMGRKIDQLKEAMTAILDELSPHDYFNVIEFSYSVTVRNLDAEVNSAVYQPFASFPHSFYQEDTVEQENNAQNTRPFPATDEYKQKAKRIIEKMTAGGGTNINDALKTAVEIAKRGVSYDCENATESSNKTCQPTAEVAKDSKPPQPIIIFLTDGEPTVGETRVHKIQTAINEINSAPKSPIYCLAFGEGADFKFLKGLALANNGFGRQIYEAADAQKQLNNFYRLLASPLLANVTFKYPPEVDNETLTKHEFSNLFRGSELVIAGKIKGDLKGGEIEALSKKGLVTYHLPEPKVSDNKYGALERLWAYVTIRQLLEEQEVLEATTPQYPRYPDPEQDKEDKAANKTATVQPKEKALAIALKYSFVCPLTSLVVVKPNGTDKLNTESAAPSENDTPSFMPFTSKLGFAAMGAMPISAQSSTTMRKSIYRPALSGPSLYNSLSFASSAAGFPSSAFSFGPHSYGPAPPAPPAPSPAIESISFDLAIDPSSMQVNRLSFIPDLSTPAPTFDRVDSVDEEESTTSWLDELLREDTLNISTGANETKSLKLHAPSDIEESTCSVAHAAGTCLPLSMLGSCSMEEITDVDSYKSNYLCELQGQYAGVCCIQMDISAVKNNSSVNDSAALSPVTEQELIPLDEIPPQTDEVPALPKQVSEEIGSEKTTEPNADIMTTTEESATVVVVTDSETTETAEDNVSGSTVAVPNDDAAEENKSD